MKPVVLLLALTLGGAAQGRSAQAQSADEIAFVENLFRSLQPISFAKRHEYCGFIGRNREGQLIATEPLPGDRDSCPLDWPTDMAEVLASYHTHGAFDFTYYNELPSDVDMLSDQSLDVMGWIATPGGRLWYVDSRRMVTKQVCSVGCLPVAPGFYKSQAGEIAKGYTLEDLQRRLGL